MLLAGDTHEVFLLNGCIGTDDVLSEIVIVRPQ